MDQPVNAVSTSRPAEHDLPAPVHAESSDATSASAPGTPGAPVDAMSSGAGSEVSREGAAPGRSPPGMAAWAATVAGLELLVLLLLLGADFTWLRSAALAAPMIGAGLAVGGLLLPWLQWRMLRPLVRGATVWILFTGVGRVASLGVLLAAAPLAGRLAPLVGRIGLMCAASSVGGLAMGRLQSLAFRREAGAALTWTFAYAMSYLLWMAAAVIANHAITNPVVWLSETSGKVVGAGLLLVLCLSEALLTAAARADVLRDAAGNPQAS